MCVILSIYQKKPKTNFALLQKIYELGIMNPDGIGIVAFNTSDNKILVKRTMKMDNARLADILGTYQVSNREWIKTTALGSAEDSIQWLK